MFKKRLLYKHEIKYLNLKWNITCIRYTVEHSKENKCTINRINMNISLPWRANNNFSRERKHYIAPFCFFSISSISFYEAIKANITANALRSKN